MDEIARLAHSMGAVAIVDGKEVWATASGGVVRKLMLAARDAALADVIDICSRKPHLRAGDIEAEVDDMRSNG